jgi:putative redox protein
MSKPPTVVDLVWTTELQFAARTARSHLILDSAGVAGPSPVDTLLAALGGCMAMDLAHILRRGRHAYRGLRAHLVGNRAADDPHRLLAVSLHFVVEGSVPAAAIERAISLSRETYCSVWQSLRQDIELQVTFDVVP